MKIKEEKLQKELQKAGISLVLDTYEDIFSDFDPRPFSERALSDDFLGECKKAVVDKQEGFELLLSMPQNLRYLVEEARIKKRLKDHFKKHYFDKKKELDALKREGIVWACLGTLLLLAIVVGSVKIENIWLNSLLILLEVPGWFFVWEGLSKWLIDSKEKQPEQDFYRKMSSAQITFRSY